MNEETRKSISEVLADDTLVNEGIGQAVREAVLKHARAGQPVATWQDGKVVWIPADDVLSHLSNGPTT
jgi:hypothetical protein